MTHIISNNQKSDWIDNLTCGKKANTLACIPIVNNILFCIKESRLNKTLKNESLSNDYKLERLDNMRAFTVTLAKWSSIPTIASIAFPILLPLTLGSQIFFFIKRNKTRGKLFELQEKISKPIQEEKNAIWKKIDSLEKEIERIYSLRPEDKASNDISDEEFNRFKLKMIHQNEALITKLKIEDRALEEQLLYIAESSSLATKCSVIKKSQFPRGLKIADADTILEIE
jgi:hypothetical protein